jgi:hypothetical protein
MNKFVFSDPELQESWLVDQAGWKEILLHEIQPIVNEPLVDNLSSLRTKLRQYTSFMNRLAYALPKFENYFEAAFSQAWTKRAENNEITQALAKQQALADISEITLMLGMSKRLWEAMDAGKSNIKKLMETEFKSGMAYGEGHQ